MGFLFAPAGFIDFKLSGARIVPDAKNPMVFAIEPVGESWQDRDVNFVLLQHFASGSGVLTPGKSIMEPVT